MEKIRFDERISTAGPLRGVRVFGLIILAGTLAACGPTEEMEVAGEASVLEVSEPGPSGDGPSTAVAPVPDTLVESSLEAPLADDRVDGRVLVLWRSADDPLELVVEAEGLRTGDHAWDVHAGSCTAPGPVALAMSETPGAEGVVGPLRVDQTGMVDLVVEVPELAGMVPSEGRYTLHVHEATGIVHGEGAENPTTVACARL